MQPPELWMLRFRLPNSGERLKPGMYVQAKVATGSTKGILVNRSAILKMLGSAAYYAFVSVNEKYAKRVDIVVGREFDSKVEILKGLNYGDYLVTKGQSLLKDSTKISVKSKFE
jgi:multidrug efflux pump subunit AcrA (membrane-fusion protein)